MNDSPVVNVTLFIIIFLSFFLFLGEPDLHDVFIDYLESKTEVCFGESC